MVISYFPGRGTVFEEAYYEGEAKGKAAGEAQGKVLGEAKGKAEGVLRVLEVRGIAVSDEVRERVVTCTDLARLDEWLGRAVTVERVEDLFLGESDGTAS
ncbi:hypothetical protein [Streptomyces fumanus]|uniref:Uncharacterized protein n=1 Tax=Streptomyces fumanus TaxID=67302 RepID=A0A919ALB1_9ACTN|nr:hypothetical protein [Streptomyces fumanus]GHF13862.1 hypothetical protein GCM10018772_43910 [Streptomyces fumanus]